MKQKREGVIPERWAKNGFTLIELLIVCVIISLLLAGAYPYFKSMQDEGVKTKARTCLETLKKAVEAYAASPRVTGIAKYPDGTNSGPQANWNGPRTAGSGWQVTHLTVQYNAGSAPLGTTGTIVSSVELLDPFSPAGMNVEYGYYVNSQGYFVLWSNGTNRININCTINSSGVVTAPGSAVYVTNGA